MAANSRTPDPEFSRHRRLLLSRGHNPNRFLDMELPTQERSIFADGGPGKQFPGAQGTNPWVLGSFGLGSNQIWLFTRYKFSTGTPGVWFKLRHSRSGSTTSVPDAGTLEDWLLASRGESSDRAPWTSPLRAIKGPGTIFLYAFGAGSIGGGTSSNRVHRALGTRATDRHSGLVQGFIV